jgi:hypothetical protein
MRQVAIEGYSPSEILNLPDEQMDTFVFCGEPTIFRAGSAEILGEFKIVDDALVVELAHIEGGGEGVLPTLWTLAGRYAKRKGLRQVEWIVHAVNCARPNLKLRDVLEHKGFAVEDVGGVGPAYHLIQQVKHEQEP